MLFVGLILLYLAINKKFEPLLLVPIGFGTILSNIPEIGLAYSGLEKIIFEKTSSLLNSNIIVAKQSTNKIKENIKKTISNNRSNKFFHNENYSFTMKENDFFYYEDQLGGIKLPMPNVKGQFQLENISTAIATLRTIKNFDIKDEHIKQGITKINSIARLQEIKSGKLKELAKDHQLFVDGSHNPLGAKVLNEYLESLNCNKHIILGMMANKDHNEYMSLSLIHI